MMETPFEIYVHVPFCVRKCLYCDFYSGAFGEAAEAAYFESLWEEIGDSPYAGRNVPVSSVFFGGGTPSAVKPERILETLRRIRSAFNILPDAEVSIEANPGTVDLKALQCYHDAGINRLSLGLQSADDRLLRKLGRIHTFDQFLKSYRDARAAGFRNVNVDLMLGLPEDTPENFEKGLKTVLFLRPEHFSVYSLIIEENTPFYASYGPRGTKTDELPSEEAERAMYHRTRELLFEAGYRQYEISNFALPGFECRHNDGYWTHVPYLGFGAAAASFTDGLRYRNAARLDYFDHPYEETEILSGKELEDEYLMLGFRRTDGISDRIFTERFGHSYRDARGREIDRLIMEGLIEAVKNPVEKEKIRLTERGLDLANLVFEAFIPDF